jgi:hypothetical protein
MKTLSELLVQYTSAEIAQQILDELAAQDPPIPVTSWQSGSIAPTLIAVFADSESNLEEGRYNVATGGYLSLASGDWLTLLADQNYGVSRAEAVAAQGLVLISDSGGGPHTITSGVTTVSNGTRSYLATASSSVPLNKSLFVPVQAVLVGQAGNVANGAITTLVTAMAGASASNPIPWISRIGTSAIKTQGYIKLTSVGGGSVGVGACTVSDGAGHLYTNAEAVTLAAATQTEVLFEAAAVGTAYNVGPGLITTVTVNPLSDISCTNTAPSVNITSWVTRAGSDAQSDASLRSECQNLLLARGVDWTSAGITYLVQQAPITDGTQITRIQVVSNPGSVAGTVAVYIASAAGAVSSGAVTDVQTYLDANRSLCATITAISASALPITITGTAKAPTSYLAQAQASASANLAALAASTPIGGSLATNYSVQLEAIISAISNASYDTSGNQTNPAAVTQLSLSAPVGDTALATGEVPTFTVNLTWVGV